MEQQQQTLRNLLRRHGYRLTAAREAILRALVETGGHVSADELAVQVRQTAPNVGRMTVYRTLDLLQELGVVRPVYQGTGAAHYILLHHGHHHHLVCSACDRVIEFDDCAIGDITHLISDRFNFDIRSHLLEFHGLCEDCQG